MAARSGEAAGIAPMRSACVLAIAACMLAACATTPPTGPTVLALPGHDKTFEQFTADDAECRRFAQRLQTTAPASATAVDDLQRRYDVAYIQCMYSKGHRVPVAGTFASKPPGQPPPPPPPQKSE